MKTLILSLTAFATLNLWAADVTIKGADFGAKGLEAKLSIRHMGVLNDNPRVSVNDKVLQISIPNSALAGKINKTMNGAYISASASGEDTVAMNVTLPYSLQGREADITITLKEGVIDVNFPLVELAKKAVTRTPAITDKTVISEVAAMANNAEAEKLDENYLSNLVKDQEKLAIAKHAGDEKVNNKAPKTTQVDTDRVTMTQAGVAKSTAAGTQTTENSKATEGKSNFSIGTYVGKFVAFLGLMVLGFYGVLTLFKKGIIKKGKLGFLHSTKLVEVLSTTHVAPKRTLMMVKAHKQVFLISNSESGMQFISEIQDVTGLIKTGEEEVTGSNFDTNLYTANKAEKQFKLKEESQDSGMDDYAMDSLDDMLNDSVPAKASKGIEAHYEAKAKHRAETAAAKSIDKAPVKDQVRFSDQIKTKMKNLKQL